VELLYLPDGLGSADAGDAMKVDVAALGVAAVNVTVAVPVMAVEPAP
jgi:hypothetical protein